MSEFRKLSKPIIVERATPRSQALGGLRMFGPMTTKTLAEGFGVSRETLVALEKEGLVENAIALNRESVEWWRLTEKGIADDS